ncbi:hypothetical protein [Natrarchaeobaculum sulfurireducens]|uniref:Uncharacterized protein n=1 Tax=Natrarchaeobaculum sulfurireducens TaxID=2044521 RepID=A0A346PTR0_9EURY|nr:hypothetical protein [Natrarchaeobaculum sulfurireducens]AXR77129.1 hypothetical protein AArc1_0787 [Natrarchaeobaculum sulfurireducens]AXR82905.1 hypothetical protein AArcMg_2916 [Natrarchaeobaculum sulfurireducens]
MDEQEVQRDREAATVIRLDSDRERDLLAGTATEVDDTTPAADALERFAEQLEGYRKNAEHEEAWVRTLRLPEAGQPDAGDEIEIEFLLPSGDSFTRTFTVPPQNWPADNDLVRLLEHVGRTPATLTEILGDAVTTVHDGSQWRLTLEDAVDERDSTDGSSDHWDERWAVTLLFATLLPLVVVSQILSPMAFFLGSSAVTTVVLYSLGGIALLVTIGFLFASIVHRDSTDRGRPQL